jgi:hypothetical protein
MKLKFETLRDVPCFKKSKGDYKPHFLQGFCEYTAHNPVMNDFEFFFTLKDESSEVLGEYLVLKRNHDLIKVL